MTSHVPVLIVGAGISGLVCAHALQKAGVGVLVVDAAERHGGAIQSERRDGYLLELGPQSFSGTAPLLALCKDLEIENEMVQAPSQFPRYVLVDGTLRRVPLKPQAVLTSGLFGLATKWAIVRDVIGRSHPPAQDESVGAFVRRKFSGELLDRLVGPFVSGVYAGDPERLSLRSAFPMLYEAERSQDSVIRGLQFMSHKEPRERPTLLSFREGTETLVRALSGELGDQRRSSAQVTRVQMNTTDAGGNYIVTIRTSRLEETVLADHVILSTPSEIAGQLLREVNPAFETLLGAIEYAPVAVVSLGYRRPDVGHTLNGFGFLVPRSAGLRILGTVWNSSLFPGRAPNEHVLVTNFVGGATDPQAVSLSPAELISLTHRELAPVLSIRQGPSFSNVTTYPRALPQYNLGHGERVAAIEQLRTKHLNLWLAGNYLRGPSIGACVEQSAGVAEEILSRIQARR